VLRLPHPTRKRIHLSLGFAAKAAMEFKPPDEPFTFDNMGDKVKNVAKTLDIRQPIATLLNFRAKH
jgi:hypothetical protein